MRSIVFIVVAVAFILVSSCASEPTSGRPLVETHWLFTSVDGDTSGIGGISPRPYLMVRPGKDGLRFQVYAGCNNILGHLETDSVSMLRFSRIASTRKACLQMELENRLQGVLPMVDGYEIAGDQLKLMDGKELRAALQAGPEAAE